MNGGGTTAEEGERANAIAGFIQVWTDVIFNEQWNRAHQLLDAVTASNTSLFHTNQEISRLGVVTHNLCANPAAPLELFRRLLAVAGKQQILEYRDPGSRRNCFHTAAEFLGDRCDVWSLLLQARPAGVLERDVHGSRPLDILTREIVLREQFLHSLWPLQQVRTLSPYWESVRRLLIIQYSLLQRESKCDMNSRDSKTLVRLPVLHACFALPDVPVELRQFALVRHHRQLVVPDVYHGNLPLHWAVAQPCPDEEDFVLVEMIRLAPEAARVRNRDGHTPFDIAVAHGSRRWKSGCRELIQAFPECLLFPTLLSFSTKQDQLIESIPLLLTELAVKDALGVVFCTLRGKPDLFLNPR